VNIPGPRPDPPEEELLARVEAGDEEAFGILFTRYTDLLIRFARQWLPAAVQRKVSAADVVQEANLVALRRLGDFELRTDDGFRNWLLKIVRLKAREAVRQYREVAGRSVRRETTRDLRAETGAHPGKQPSPSAMAIGREAEERAVQAMRTLPDDYRLVLELVRRDQVPMHEVAARIGRSHEAAKKLYMRALARFRQEFLRLGGCDG
jgi:RNA polymerase sigma-70 factor (ECF subfamily)